MLSKLLKLIILIICFAFFTSLPEVIVTASPAPEHSQPAYTAEHGVPGTFEVTNEAINTSGERKSEHEEKREGYYRSERSYGSFYRSIPLPEGVNADDANATFRNGVLEITMQAPQRQTERSSRRLEIKEGTEGQQQTQAHGAAAGQKR
ncbi:MAG TPA: Hsp20/alpha crystallin family protein [Pyrinomonadaceae bacterium]|jgi:hypothetical protein